MSKINVIEYCNECIYNMSGYQDPDKCGRSMREFTIEEGKIMHLSFPTWCPLEDHDTGIKISTISKVTLTPNDCLVVNIHEGIFDDEQYAHMQQNLETTFPDNKVLVMQGVTLSVIDETEIPSAGD